MTEWSFDFATYVVVFFSICFINSSWLNDDCMIESSFDRYDGVCNMGALVVGNGFICFWFLAVDLGNSCFIFNMVRDVYVAFKRFFGAWLYFSSRYFCSFCSAVAYETRTVSMVYRLECPGRSVLEGCVLLIISSMPFLAYSFFYFVANTTYFPEVEDRNVG